ncbi:MAG: ferredoxin [Rhodobacteraceae bacterium]|nr:ferredoxin [Paracoccaceae bacterium]
MSYTAIAASLEGHGLMIMGALHAPEAETLILIGADAVMWSRFQATPECNDGRPDPLDRWSKRVIGQLAIDFGTKAAYPSDGPPYPPFIGWALASARFWQSPAGMMVHDHAGLMISLRGALLIDDHWDLPAVTATSPCDTCIGQPCRTSCPVDALSREIGYDVASCKTYLDTDPGRDCMETGCRARRVCPVSQRFDRPADQSAFHMKAFHPQ